MELSIFVITSVAWVDCRDVRTSQCLTRSNCLYVTAAFVKWAGKAKGSVNCTMSAMSRGCPEG
jgi:hypothetical protein